ncbi:MAG: QueT transporter family protein [Thermofilaceae archaeon]
MDAKAPALSALIAAMYAVLVAALPMVSFLMWQVRLADSLLMLSTVLGWPAIIGVTVGCFIGNLSAPWGSIGLILLDAALGSLANFLASYAGYMLAYGRGLSEKLAAAVAEIVIVSFIVGTYIKYLMLWAFGINIPLAISILGVVPGSVVAIGVLGTALAVALEKRVRIGDWRPSSP